MILADADRRAVTLRGEGDAQVALIARKAFGQDAEFYSFYRSLQAYRNSFNRSDDVLVLKSDSEFLKYMRKPGK